MAWDSELEHRVGTRNATLIMIAEMLMRSYIVPDCHGNNKYMALDPFDYDTPGGKPIVTGVDQHTAFEYLYTHLQQKLRG